MAGRQSQFTRAVDRFTLRYAVWAAVGGLPLALAHDLDRMFNLWLLLVPIMLGPLLITAAWLLICLFAQLWRKNWRRAGSVAAAPLMAFAFFYAMFALGLSTDKIRFFATKHYYTKQVAALPAQNGQPKLVAFPWGETGGAAVVNIFETLVYDESGEVRLQSYHRSSAWNQRVKGMCPGTLLCSISGMHDTNYIMQATDFGDHFYLIREFYQ